MRPLIVITLAICLGTGLACAQQEKSSVQEKSAPPTTAPAPGTRLPHIQVDVKARQIKVECEALAVEGPLEFFCVLAGTSEHESVLRTRAKPSDIHLALLMLGLKPGSPVQYSPATQKWIPPHGPPLQISCMFEKDGKPVIVPANKLMQNATTKKEMPLTTWIFAGSQITEDGHYAADATGYVVSIVNFDLTLIDIPKLASNANELLEWETNLDAMPREGTRVWMVIEPAGKESDRPAPAADSATPPDKISMPMVKIDAQGNVLLDDKPVQVAHLTEQLEKMKTDRPLKVRVSAAKEIGDPNVDKVIQAIEAADVTFAMVDPSEATPAAVGGVAKADQALLKRLRERWEKSVAPRQNALREAAQTHYEVIDSLRQEQQRLIAEIDQIQRLIDELEKDYQNMTTPRPAPVQ